MVVTFKLINIYTTLPIFKQVTKYNVIKSVVKLC